MQTNYDLRFRSGRPGLIADITPRVVLSRSFRSEPAVDNGTLPYGAGVSQSTVDDASCYMAAADLDVLQKFLGVVIADSGNENNWGPSGRNYLQNDTPYIRNPIYTAHIKPGGSVSVMTKGRVWVYVDAPVKIGDLVCLRAAPTSDFPIRGAWSTVKKSDGRQASRRYWYLCCA